MPPICNTGAIFPSGACRNAAPPASGRRKKGRNRASGPVEAAFARAGPESPSQASATQEHPVCGVRGFLDVVVAQAVEETAEFGLVGRRDLHSDQDAAVVGAVV